MSDAQKWLLLAGLLIGAWVIYLLSPVLSPFLVGALLAYLGDPVTDRLEHRGVPRTLAVVIVFGFMFLAGLVLLFILIPLLQDQIFALRDRIPQLINWLQNSVLPWVSTTLGMDQGSIDLGAVRKTITENWQDMGSLLGTVLGKIGHSGQFLLSWVLYLGLVPVVTFYLLRDWDSLVNNTRGLLPKRYAPAIVQLVGECDAVLAEFLRGQLLVMLCLGLIYSIGLWIVGLEFALLVGMLAGMVSFVPYLGAIVGISTAGILGYLQFHDLIHLLYLGLVFATGQAMEGMVLSPLLVGDRIGLHPVAVIFAVMAGGQLFGFIGILLALPVAAVIMVILRQVHRHFVHSGIYDDPG